MAVALSSVVMGVTKTVHPPAGATALLAVCSNEVRDIGWFLVGLITLGATLMVVVACINNNIMRKYPVYWWSPTHTGQVYRREAQEEEKQNDVEKAQNVVGGDDEVRIERSGREVISIDASGIVIPGWMSLGVEEKAVLEILRNRLEQELAATRSRGSEATFVGEHIRQHDSHS